MKPKLIQELQGFWSGFPHVQTSNSKRFSAVPKWSLDCPQFVTFIDSLVQNTPNCLQLTMFWPVVVLSFDKSSWKLYICAVLETRQRFWCLCCHTNSFLAYWRPSRARFCPMQWLFLWSKANQHASHSALMHWIVSEFELPVKKYEHELRVFEQLKIHSNTLKRQHLWSNMKYHVSVSDMNLKAPRIEAVCFLFRVFSLLPLFQAISRSTVQMDHYAQVHNSLHQSWIAPVLCWTVRTWPMTSHMNILQRSRVLKAPQELLGIVHMKVAVTQLLHLQLFTYIYHAITQNRI